MIGIILLSRDEMYAKANGDIIDGPESDKQWLRDFIKDKTVFIGYKTWESIQEFPLLLAHPLKWVVGELTEPCDVHFGGPSSFLKYPPDRLIVHRLRTYEPDGLKFDCPCGKKLISCIEQTDYTEIIYAKK